MRVKPFIVVKPTQISILKYARAHRFFGCCPFKVVGYVVVASLFIAAHIVYGGFCVWSLFCYLVLCFLLTLQPSWWE